METNHTLKTTIKDFRAIHHADIILDGITLVSGLNSTGKSTIAKLIYSFLKCATDFETLVLKDFFKNTREVNHICDILLFEFFRKIDKNEFLSSSRSLYSMIKKSNNIIELETNVDHFKKTLQSLIEQWNVCTENDNKTINLGITKFSVRENLVY